MPDLAHWPPRAALRRLTLVSLAATAALFIYFRVHDRPLDPYTIVAFELAWTPAQARAMLTAWGAEGLRVARESLLVDFAFMPAYACLFAGLVLLEARRSAEALRRVGLALAAAPFGAWLLDAIENVALLGVLARPEAPPAGLLLAAGAAASLKFLLLLACLLFIVATLAARVARRPAPPAP
jgi:hypothetical protein